jgi:predicted nucleotidyltransferase
MSELVTASAQIETYRHAFQQRIRHALEEREEHRRKALLAVREHALAVLAACTSVRRAYLFGSVTRPGAFDTASDIDIAVEGTTAADYFAVWRDLERALPDWTVDVREVDVPSPFADRVQETGVLIYERADPVTSD